MMYRQGRIEIHLALLALTCLPNPVYISTLEGSYPALGSEAIIRTPSYLTTCLCNGTMSLLVKKS